MKVNQSQFKELLVRRWLDSVSPFSPDLEDTGLRYLQLPVFRIRIFLPEGPETVYVYRYTPVNSQNSVIRLVPDNVKLERS